MKIYLSKKEITEILNASKQNTLEGIVIHIDMIFAEDIKTDKEREK